MLTPPKTLAECLDAVGDFSREIASAIEKVPETGAHEEVHKMLAELNRMRPEILDLHSEVQSQFATARSKVEEQVAQAKENIAKSQAIIDGKVPQAEIEAMWRAELGDNIIPPPIPNAPENLSNQLEQELKALATPKNLKPLSSLESNAWNDWDIPVSL
jgi:hypothetical protein